MYSLSVKVYRTILHPLCTTARLIFCWVTVYVAGIFILWDCSLKISSMMLLVLFRKLGREALLPVVEIIWQSQLAVQSCCFYLANALLYCVARRALELLRQPVLPAASSTVHPSHPYLDSLLQQNNENCQIALRPVMQQVAIALFLGFFSGVQEAFRQSVTAVKYELIQFFKSVRPTHYPAYKENILDDITCSLPLTRIPLCNRFKGSAPCTLKDIPQSIAMLKFVVASEHIITGPGKYGLDVTATPLHVRFQNNSRTKNAFSTHGTDPATKQMKKACVVFFALYLSVLSIVMKMVK